MPKSVMGMFCVGMELLFLSRNLHSISRSISANMGQKRENEKPHISRQIRLFPRFPGGIENGVAV